MDLSDAYVCDAGGVAVIGVEPAQGGAVDAGDGCLAGCQPVILRQFVQPAKKLILIREPLTQIVSRMAHARENPTLTVGMRRQLIAAKCSQEILSECRGY
jgi:hypothetical protein